MRSLTYSLVDELENASQFSGVELPNGRIAAANSLGPYLYLLRAISRGTVADSALELVHVEKFESHQEFVLDDSSRIFFDVGTGTCLAKVSDGLENSSELDQRALSLSKQFDFAKKPTLEIVSALSELYSNIVEHSLHTFSGLVGFEASQEGLTIVASDFGIGALASLRSCERFAELKDSGEAIKLCIQEGVSSKAKTGRGLGFRSLFRGLSNHNGFLRFRSGDAVLDFTGVEDFEQTFSIKERPALDGFHVFAHCRP